MIEKFTPFTYFDDDVPPIFLSHGGLDDQVPPSTFARFIAAVTNSSTYHRIVFYPEAGHSLRQQELHDTFIEVFRFLDGIPVVRIPDASSQATRCGAMSRATEFPGELKRQGPEEATSVERFLMLASWRALFYARESR
jgi:fermentation-respiration switch protein FrsA (DUF1100 family)